MVKTKKSKSKQKETVKTFESDAVNDDENSFVKGFIARHGYISSTGLPVFGLKSKRLN